MSNIEKQTECSHTWPNMIPYIKQKCMGCGIDRWEFDHNNSAEKIIDTISAKQKKAIIESRVMVWWNGNKPDVNSGCKCEDCEYNQSIIDYIEKALKNEKTDE